jgi:hypothetical protein
MNILFFSYGELPLSREDWEKKLANEYVFCECVFGVGSELLIFNVIRNAAKSTDVKSDEKVDDKPTTSTAETSTSPVQPQVHTHPIARICNVINHISPISQTYRSHRIVRHRR